MNRVSRMPSPVFLCTCGLSAISSKTINTWYNFFIPSCLGLLGDLLLLGQNLAQRALVPLVPPALLAVGVHSELLSDVFFHRFPLRIHVNARTHDVHPLEAAPVLLQDHRHEENGLPGNRRSAQDPVAWRPADHRVAWLLDVETLAGEQLHFPH